MHTICFQSCVLASSHLEHKNGKVYCSTLNSKPQLLTVYTGAKIRCCCTVLQACVSLAFLFYYPVRACAAGVECLVCLSVCRFVHHFLACLHIQDILKGPLYTQQVDQVEKAACRWSAIDRNGLEVIKTLVQTQGRT